MATAHTQEVREKILSHRKEGYSMLEISEKMSVSYNSVRTLCQRYASSDQSESGIKAAVLPHYAQCGPQEKAYSAEIIEAALALKRLHPRWGAPRLRLALESEMGSKESEGGQNIPSIRSLERWYRENNLVKPKRQTGEPSIGRARAVHNIWEVDAKEQLELLDGQAACYLTMVDEKSGAWLASPVFPL
jgi:transposase